MKSQVANVLSLVPDREAAQPDLCNVPLMLRRLADRIDAGEFGDASAADFVIRCATVLCVSQCKPFVLGFGRGADPNQTFADLHAGAAELLGMSHPER